MAYKTSGDHPDNYRVGSGSTVGVFAYQPQSALLPPLDLNRIGRCHNLEAMLKAWIAKHGYEMVMHSGWYKVYAEGEHSAPIASFPVYELALQYVLDAIDAITAATDEA